MPIAIEVAAVIASALYGILLACRKEFDAVGGFAIAFAVAFGGGTLRDLLLDMSPLPHAVAVGGGFATIAILRLAALRWDWRLPQAKT